ncbi:hypothetical protein HK097_004056 [Rhizophlyctis rosea]|uniref:HIG1 domain-containing protein n=1 Tax=Rhizophlyctis rosea TaxID=64517 RepID=A0AAD5SJE7_9FUNG|nr:hypothetical protein HK097_004056 [Rhizophlyctis rosea]
MTEQPRPRRLTEAEKEARHQAVLNESLQASAISIPFAVGGSYVLHRYWGFYRNLSLPFKTLLGICVPTAVFLTVSDRAAMRADRELIDRFAVIRSDALIRPPPKKEFSWTAEGIKNYAIDNRYYVVGLGWLGTATGMMLYTWRRRDITTSQKIINARMAAQALAIGGIAATAFVGALPDKNEPVVDPHFERVVNAQKN